MTEKRVMTYINIIKNIIAVYFDTFFVFYFFKVANYEVLPLAEYYLTRYLITGLSFYLIRHNMKKNVKVPYFRIGISLSAIYISLIMILKENIINYIILVAFVNGVAEGFFYYPKNILETEKINNEERQKYGGMITIINKFTAIIIPIILGYLLTYFTYVEMGKVVFILFIILFILSFFIDDDYHYLDKKLELNKFFKIIKGNSNLKMLLSSWFLSGFTYSSGVMAIIITLTKINVFKTNLNLGFVDGACALVFLIVSLIYTKINTKYFGKISKYSGYISSIILIIFAFYPSVSLLIIYLFLRNSCVGFMNMITNYTSNNLSNSSVIKNEFKAEYFLVRDVIFSIARTLGFLILLIVCLTIGMNYITYILIICGISLFIEGILISNILKKK